MKLISFAKIFYERFLEDRVFDLSAQCAYYFLLSLFPFLIFSVTLLGFLPFTSADVLEFMAEHVPGNPSPIIEENIAMIMDVKRKGTLSLSLLFSLWTASRGMDALVYALNRAYRIKEERSFIRGTVLSVLLTLGMIIVFMSAMILTVFGEKLEQMIHLFLHIEEGNIVVSNAFRWMINLLILSLTFTLLYYIAPYKCITCKDVIPGAVLAAVGWQVSSLGFSFYINHIASFSATYGSLGGVIILMTWFYLTAMIIMIGGIINAVLPDLKKKLK